MISSRQRVELALNHEEPDRILLDLGASPLKIILAVGEVC